MNRKLCFVFDGEYNCTAICLLCHYKFCKPGQEWISVNAHDK